MKIRLSKDVAIRLMTVANVVAPLEFSGFGYAKKNGNELFVYDFELLDIGTEGSTNIHPKKIVSLQYRADRRNCKVWIHRHPINGWSATDESTIKNTPLGGIPEMVGWSASIVLTPGGWIGRIDNHKTGKTEVVDVSPNFEDKDMQVIAELFMDFDTDELVNHYEADSVEEQMFIDAAQHIDPVIMEALGLEVDDIIELALERAK